MKCEHSVSDCQSEDQSGRQASPDLSPSKARDAEVVLAWPARPISRRTFVGGSFAALAAMAAARESSLLFAGDDNEQQNLYWGDIHNHNECGLAKGTLERAIDLARAKSKTKAVSLLSTLSE